MPAVLFDLDGVLADSRPSITAALTEALVQLGHPRPTDARIRAMIGPPLRSALAELLGADPDSAVVGDAVTAYRSRYRHALRQTAGSPAVDATIAQLADAVLHLGVATSKPMLFAEPVLEVLG